MPFGWPRWVREACAWLGGYIGTGRSPRVTRTRSPRRSAPPATAAPPRESLRRVRSSRIAKRAPKRRAQAQPDLSTVQEESATQSPTSLRAILQQPHESLEDKIGRMRDPRTSESPSIRAQRFRGTKRRSPDADTDTISQRLRSKRQRSNAGSPRPSRASEDGSRGSKRSHHDTEGDDGEASRTTKRTMTTADYDDRTSLNSRATHSENAANETAGRSTRSKSSGGGRGRPMERRTSRRGGGAGPLQAPSTNGRRATPRDEDGTWSDTMDSAAREQDERDDLASTTTRSPVKRSKAPSAGTQGASPSRQTRKGEDGAAAAAPGDAALRAEAQQLEGDVKIERGVVAHKDDPEFADRTQLEIDLFNWINGRGLDPIFPAAWKADFSTFPEAMFFDDDSSDGNGNGNGISSTTKTTTPTPTNSSRNKPLIRSLRGNTFRALRQFQALVDVGARVAERREQGLPTSLILQRAFNKYNNWVRADAGLAGRRDVLPNLIVKASKLREIRSHFIARVRADLAALAARHRAQAKADGQPASAAPVVFAIMIWGHSVIVVAVNAALDKAAPMARANFLYGPSGMDLWHAIGIAIIVALLRDEQLKRFGGFEEAVGDGTEGDREDDGLVDVDL